ncbi:MAG: ATP-dependent sacrificial sulfur transferase LarE [Methanobrevibacter sp.]|nr:ATP-dependent sacrificial sulfur transferase LarE [Methanobrevibacter sp.]
MRIEDKINIVKTILKNKKVVIGFSGGADSTLISYLASKVSKDVLAITINNNLMPTNFVENTQKLAKLFNIKQEIVNINFYEDETFCKNDSERCYYCRNLMYSQIENIAHKNDFDFICDGNNISDLVLNRPGILITYDKGFKTPLIEAKLTSKEIHEYLDLKKIPYFKSTTCLATRIPTDEEITCEKIEKIGVCEDYILTNTNCQIVKLRDLNEFSICEVDNINEILHESKYKQINDEFKRQGFNKVALNLSEIDDDEDIILDFEKGSFSYQLPYNINIENTKKQLDNFQITDEKIKIKNITINKNGLINGKNFKDYKSALNAFMEILTKIKREL